MAIAVLLAASVLLAGMLGLVHQTLHAKGGMPAAGSTGISAPAASQPVADARGVAALFHHQDGGGDCRLYDQLAHGAALPTVAALLLPVLPPLAVFAFLEGQALARWAALFDARGPPAAR